MTSFWELNAKTTWISLPGHDIERLPPATKRGKIASLWRIEGERFTLRVEIPPDTSASVWLPTTDSGSVFAPLGAALARVEDGSAVYEVGAGVHQFTCRLA